MPKMKTKRAAAKRFKTTPTGKVRRANAFKSHILEKKSPKRKRAFKSPSLVSKVDEDKVRKMLGTG